MVMLLLSLFGGITLLLMESKKFKVHEVLSNFKSMALLISILLLFSPVMLTVNQTYADNTIYALVSLSILLHLILRDYDYESVAS